MLPKIYHINYREYVIANPSTHTMIKYKNGTEIAINANNFQIGAAYIKIPCDASIVEKQHHHDREVTLVDTLTPCFQEDKPSEPWIVRTTPAQWTKYPPTEIEHGLHAIHNYDSNIDIINRVWKKLTPTTHLKTVAEYESEMKNITLQATTNTIFGSQFYADIVYMALFAILFTLVFLLYYLLIKQAITNVIPDPLLKINPLFENHSPSIPN